MNDGTKAAISALAQAGRSIHARGWVPATSGNFSVRLGNGTIAVTASGKDKSSLTPDDIMQIDLSGRPLDSGEPSAETSLHLQLYRRDADIGAVLHTHSLNATLVSGNAQDTVEFAGLELLKAFRGIGTHESSIAIPVFGNSQEIGQLAESVEGHMRQHGQGQAYLIRGHGLYTWGRDLSEALRHLEALDFLLGYHRRAAIL